MKNKLNWFIPLLLISSLLFFFKLNILERDISNLCSKYSLDELYCQNELAISDNKMIIKNLKTLTSNDYCDIFEPEFINFVIDEQTKKLNSLRDKTNFKNYELMIIKERVEQYNYIKKHALNHIFIITLGLFLFLFLINFISKTKNYDEN